MIGDNVVRLPALTSSFNCIQGHVGQDRVLRELEAAAYTRSVVRIKWPSTFIDALIPIFLTLNLRHLPSLSSCFCLFIPRSYRSSTL